MDLDSERFHFILPPSLHIHAKKKLGHCWYESRGEEGRGEDGRGGEGEGCERSREKGGKAGINTALIDSTQTHAKLPEK